MTPAHIPESGRRFSDKDMRQRKNRQPFPDEVPYGRDSV
jgi:hypothetical protein